MNAVRISKLWRSLPRSPIQLPKVWDENLSQIMQDNSNKFSNKNSVLKLLKRRQKKSTCKLRSLFALQNCQLKRVSLQSKRSPQKSCEEKHAVVGDRERYHVNSVYVREDFRWATTLVEQQQYGESVAWKWRRNPQLKPLGLVQALEKSAERVVLSWLGGDSDLHISILVFK